MGDYTITQFKGINSTTDQRDLDKGEFADGQNFYVKNGALTKRNGCSKLYAYRTYGAITGLIHFYGKMREQVQWDNATIPVTGELIIISSDYFYTGKY